MKYCFKLTFLLLLFCVFLNSIKADCQQYTTQAKNGMTAGIKNYTSFTTPYKDNNPEAIQANAGYEQHPETGMLFAETPCDNCYELIGKRTEISKTFIKEGTHGRDIMQQTSSAAMHYRDAQGNWRTIIAHLQPGGQGIYAMTGLPVPVIINTAQKYTSLGNANEQFSFNNNLELLYAAPDGSIASLGAANWSSYTAGDDGVYVTNAWPGMDMEIYTIRGAVKTNYIINRPMPAYSAGKLLVRDHLQLSAGLKLNTYGQTAYTGNLEVTNNAGERIYGISAATAFEKNAIRSTFKMLEYYISDNTLDIALPGNFLNRPATSYPVIIDPLVSASTNSTVTGSTYSAHWTTGCTYVNPATVPAKVTVTDVQFSFQYVTSGGALLSNGAFDFKLGTCRSPSPPTIWWNCNSTLTGTCTGSNASIFPSLAACMPAPQCSSFNMNLTMNFYQNYLTDVACGTQYITAGSPLNITVFGHTIESTTAAASPAIVCQGQSSSLSAATQNGVAPYTYKWMPGNVTGSPANVTPGATTIYTVTSTDACGGTSTGTTTVTVSPLSTITGSTLVCQGSTTALHDASAGGTWSSGNTVVATISNTGVVSGVTAGTSVISYITPTTCYATTTVTVAPMPATITGITTLCAGSTTMLSEAITGGTWSSNNTVAATVANNGTVSGVSGGIATIIYSTAAGCTKTTNVTVNPLLPTTGTATVCQGYTTTLVNVTPGGGTWSSASTGIATVSGGGAVTGVSAGTSVIKFTTTAGCIAATTVTVLASPVLITGTKSVCQGSTTTLSDATPGGTWSSGSTAIATVNPSTGAVGGASGGVAVITYTSVCPTTTSVTVNPLGPITGSTGVCVGGTTTLNNIGGAGTWSSSNTSVATINSSTGTVTGLTTGTTNITYTSSAGCVATTVVNVNLIIPITGNTTVCQGSNTTLSNSTTGGTWTSSATTVAQVTPSGGMVTGISGGTATITYTSAGGCYVTTPVTVNPIAPVTGAAIICQGNSTPLSDATPGGTWSSSNTLIATVDATTGMVSGITNGTAAIVYTTGMGCTASAAFVVTGLPATITGTTAICNSATLSDATTGGTWTSNNTAVVIISAATGAITGTGAGTAIITYSIPGGCFVTTTVSMNLVSPITGTPSVCAGSNITLSDATTGGTWSSSNTLIATVDAATGEVSGKTAGSDIIKYTTPAGCIATATVTVNVLPSVITGNTSVCQGSTTILSDAPTGGTWVSASPGVAVIGMANGVVTPVSAGTAIVVYTTVAGCSAVTTVTVNPLAPITGAASVCQESATTLSDATPSGTWSSANTARAIVDNTGTVTGTGAGIVNIRYTTPPGCIATIPVTVNPRPTVITGSTTLCAGSVAALSNSISGGTWSSAASGTATINLTTGALAGITSGTTTVTYITTAGCARSATVTVNPLPSGITGNASICEGAATTLSDATTGGTWTMSNTAIATITGTSGVLTGVSAGAAISTYTSPLNCFVTAAITINPLPSAITGTPVVCEGAVSTLGNALPGGTWSSATTAVATIGVTTGVLSGISAGATIITYITPAGCFAVTTATVNPTPIISGYSSTGLTTCITNDGTITLNGLTAGAAYTVKYLFGGTHTFILQTANSSGNVVITGLAAGAYTGITVTSASGCSSDIVTGPVVLSLPAAPATPVAGNNTPICDGAALQLTATDATPGVTYSWSGPTGFTSVTQNPVIDPAHVNQSGAYTVTATRIGCVSAPATTAVVIHPIPNISGSSYTNPKTCYGTDGTITLTGLTPGISYFVTYIYNNNPAGITIVADGTGKVIITGLSAGTYTDFSVSSFTCVSNSIGTIILSDPLPPPVPILGSNSPICAGKTLLLTATDSIKTLTYSWTGPNNFSSAEQDPVIPNVTMADSGLYSLTISYLNCQTSASEYIIIYPPVALTHVTESQKIPYGGYVQLHAEGALYYAWTPTNGTLNNPDIYNPVAAPLDSTTYIVTGLNEWGCRDSASVQITINYNADESIPSAFTPNGDGKNDVFRIVNRKFVRLVDFSVFDRWGKLIYHNTYDAQQGWDGTYNGVPQDMGVYFFSITVEMPDGQIKKYKGDVTLIR